MLVGHVFAHHEEFWVSLLIFCQKKIPRKHSRSTRLFCIPLFRVNYFCSKNSCFVVYKLFLFIFVTFQGLFKQVCSVWISFLWKTVILLKTVVLLKTVMKIFFISSIFVLFVFAAANSKIFTKLVCFCFGIIVAPIIIRLYGYSGFCW